jgi:hypothetical protein
VQFKDVNLKDFVDANVFNLAKKLNGVGRGTLRGRINFPQKDWKAQQLLKGQIFLKRGTFSEWDIEQVLADGLSKISGLGNETQSVLNSGPFEMNLAFSVAKSRWVIKKLSLLTSSNIEVQMDGIVDPDWSWKLEGTTYMKKAPVRGTVFLANRDGQGRFTSPLTIRGGLFNPIVHFKRETVDELLANAMKYESGLALDKARAELQRRDQEEKLKLEQKARSKAKSL